MLPWEMDVVQKYKAGLGTALTSSYESAENEHNIMWRSGLLTARKVDRNFLKSVVT